jgi:hypothetical protein
MLDYALNDVIPQTVDPYADSFTELVSSLAPCRAAGKWIKDELDFGSDEMFGIACAAAVDQAAKRMLPINLKEIEADMSVTGDAKLYDENGDDKVDVLSDGAWEGELAYPNQMVRLRRPDQTFYGNRSRAKRYEDDI